jgi:hypothetical protein
MAWLGTFKYRRKISISDTEIDAVLSNFPIRIHISASSGTGSTDITDVFTELGADANRKKIAITTSDEITQCYVEIELFDFANTDAEFWAKAPSVASGATTELYIYYDSSQADNTTYVGDTGDTPAQSVWDSNFKLVMHMAQDPNGDVADAIKDSTSNVNHGTPGGSMTSADLVDGKVGKGINFDGSNDYLTKAAASDFDLTTFTIEEIVNLTDNGVSNTLFAYGSSSTTINYRLFRHRFQIGYGSGSYESIDPTVPAAYGANVAVSLTKDGNSIIHYKNGVTNGSGNLVNSQRTGIRSVYIGKTEWGATDYYFVDGIIDEVRISNTVRSAAWIKATYYSNWDGLILYGDIESKIIVTSPLTAESTGHCNIKVKIVPPSLSAVTSISISKILKGYIVHLIDSLKGESSGSSNIKVKIKQPSPLSSTGSISISKIFKGYIVHLIDSLKGESSGSSNIKVGLKSGTFDGASTGKSNIKVKIKPGPLSATTSMNVIKVSTFVKRIAKLIDSFGEQSQDAISSALGLEDRQPVRLDLSPGAQEIQALINNICGGDVASIQKLIGKIAEKDYISGQQKILQSLEDLSVLYPSVSYDILLDDISIKSSVVDAIVSYSEDSVHNSVNINSSDKQLFLKSDPADLEGTSRIEIQIDGRQIYFLLEKRNGDERTFTLWGRSLSAREDNPYVDELDYSLDTPKSAEEVAGEILTILSLDWQCEDWVLQDSFEFEGTPIDGLLQIVNAIGAVVRCKDDGTIYIRQRFPVRPINMGSAAATVSYNRANITRLEHGYSKGSHYNIVKVVGATDDVFLPDITIEETELIVGYTCHIRVYWAGKKPSGIIGTYVTDGIITALGELTTEENESETITFMDGIGSVSLPITSVVSVDWEGDSGGEVSYEKYSKDLEIDNEAYRIAEVTYKTTYSRYRIQNSYVELLLALLTFGGESDITVDVITEEGDKQAPDISSPFLTSQSIAVVLGTAWIDKNKYDQKQIVLETPYDGDAIDGVLAYVNDAEIDCVGNFHIFSCNIVMRGARVTNELGLIQCQV